MYTEHEHKKQDEVVEKDQALELFEAAVPSSGLSEPAPSSEHVDSSLNGHLSLKVYMNAN